MLSRPEGPRTRPPTSEDNADPDGDSGEIQQQEPRLRTVPMNRFMALHARLSEGSQQSFVISKWD